MKTAYVNGKYVPLQRAVVPMQDRGYQFADGVYEVAMFYNRCFLDIDLHLKRLHRSLARLYITEPMKETSLRLVMQELVRRNPYRDGYIYLQITRGIAPRNHLFPVHAKPSVTMCVMPTRPAKAGAYEQGVKVITAEDIRWAWCDIKSTALLPNVLLKNQAQAAGAAEAFLFNKEGCLTECSVSTAYIVKDGVVLTHPENEAVLPGVRKVVVKNLCQQHGIAYEERMITRQEVFAADEAFLTSANSHILPVTRIDDALVADGKVGAVSRELLTYYKAHVTTQTGKEWI
jgi:D-alanine transaminase